MPNMTEKQILASLSRKEQALVAHKAKLETLKDAIWHLKSQLKEVKAQAKANKR